MKFQRRCFVMRTVSAALPAAVGATSAAQKMSGSRRITSSVKGKRARPADSVSFKGTLLTVVVRHTSKTEG